MRLGWVTSNEFFGEKLDMLTDSSSQHPHGLGQAFIAELLGSQGWGADGFMKWVSSLCNEYQRRRDLFMRVFEREVAGSGFASAEVPQSGMFVWIKINLDRHSRYRVLEDTKGLGVPVSNTAELMDELFRKLIDCGLVMMPASTFAIVDRSGRVSTDSHIADVCLPAFASVVFEANDRRQRVNYFRATFVGTDETIENGLTIFGRCLDEFFCD